MPPSESYECDLPSMSDVGGNYHYAGKLGKWLYYRKLAMNGKGTIQLTSEQRAQLQLLVDEGKVQIHIVRKKKNTMIFVCVFRRHSKNQNSKSICHLLSFLFNTSLYILYLL